MNPYSYIRDYLAVPHRYITNLQCRAMEQLVETWGSIPIDYTSYSWWVLQCKRHRDRKASY